MTIIHSQLKIIIQKLQKIEDKLDKESSLEYLTLPQTYEDIEGNSHLYRRVGECIEFTGPHAPEGINIYISSIQKIEQWTKAKVVGWTRNIQGSGKQ